MRNIGKPGLRALLVGCAVILPCAGTAFAHHSAAMFDSRRILALSGTVREVQWTNPHCYIQLLVRNDKGVDEEWSIEMGAPLHVKAWGVTKSTIKAGDRISVKIHPLRNGSRGGELVEAITSNGKLLGDAT